MIPKSHILIIATVFMVSFSITIDSEAQQPWAQPGAHWFYQFGDGTSFSSTGYLEVKKVGDTLNNNILCDVLTVHYHYLQLWSGSIQDFYGPNRYTYVSDDTVYISYANQFEVMFVGDAAPNDYWITGSDEDGICVGDSIFVDSLQVVNVNNVTMNRIVPKPLLPIAPPFGPSIAYNEPIYERFGSTGYFFPIATCITDAAAGPIRCYSDSSGFMYTTNIVPSCDYITGQTEISNLNSVPILFPTLSTDHFYISIPNLKSNSTATISIYSISGRLIDQYQTSDQLTKVESSHLPIGNYRCNVELAGQTTSLTVIKASK